MKDIQLVPMTLHIVQYRDIGGNRRWKNVSSTARRDHAESLLKFMIKNAEVPVEGRIIEWTPKGEK